MLKDKGKENKKENKNKKMKISRRRRE